MLDYDPQLPRPIDVVTIRTENNLLSRVKINGIGVIGSAKPCDRYLVNGEKIGPAIRCLERNGFSLVFEQHNLLVFRRVP